MPGSAAGGAAPVPSITMDELVRHILQLSHPDLSVREQALLELSKRREEFADLAPLLWYAHGAIAALLQEIISIYPSLSPATLTANASNRACNALALLQCVASHTETRQLFLAAHIPLYLYPFLNTASRSRPFEYLRLTSLGVIGALVKVGGRKTGRGDGCGRGRAGRQGEKGDGKRGKGRKGGDASSHLSLLFVGF